MASGTHARVVDILVKFGALHNMHLCVALFVYDLCSFPDLEGWGKRSLHLENFMIFQGRATRKTR